MSTLLESKVLSLKGIKAKYPDVSPFVILKNDAGRVVLLELSEYSETNRNLVRAIWFDRKVALSLRSSDNRSYHIVGKPERAIIAGPVFERYYQDIHARLGDVDLSTVWIIEAESLAEKGKAAAAKVNEGRLPLIHLDRISAVSQTH